MGSKGGASVPTLKVTLKHYRYPSTNESFTGQHQFGPLKHEAPGSIAVIEPYRVLTRRQGAGSVANADSVPPPPTVTPLRTRTLASPRLGISTRRLR